MPGLAGHRTLPGGGGARSGARLPALGMVCLSACLLSRPQRPANVPPALAAAGTLNWQHSGLARWALQALEMWSKTASSAGADCASSSFFHSKIQRFLPCICRQAQARTLRAPGAARHSAAAPRGQRTAAGLPALFLTLLCSFFESSQRRQRLGCRAIRAFFDAAAAAAAAAVAAAAAAAWHRAFLHSSLPACRAAGRPGQPPGRADGSTGPGAAGAAGAGTCTSTRLRPARLAR